MFKKSLLGLAIAVTASPTLAGLEFIEYTNQENESKVISDFSDLYLNNKSGVELFISSGLDRKLRVKLLKSGSTVEDTTTAVINTNDRISISGKEFYGKVVSLSGLSSDGDFTIQIDTQSLNGEVVATDTYELTRDTVAPVINDSDITWTRKAYSYGSIDHFSYSDTSFELRLKSLSEDRSGLSHVDYFISTPARLSANPADKTIISAQLNKDTEMSGSASIRTEVAAHPNVAPAQGLYTIGFHVYDQAGNKGTIQRNSHIDNVCPAAPSVQVLNASTGKWEPYSANMTIYSNPITMRWGRDKSTFESGSKSPYGWVDDYLADYTEGSTVYHQRTFPVPQDYSYFVHSTRAGEICHRQSLSTFKFTYGPGIDAAPAGNYIRYKSNLSSSWSGNDRPKFNKPYTVTTVRHYAQARSYRQKAWGANIPACYIEPGNTYCDSTTNIVRSSGKGYSPLQMYLSKDDGSLQVHYGYLYTFWDMNDPQVVDVKAYPTSKSIVAKSYDPDTVSTWQSGEWVISKVQAELKSTSNSNTYTLSPSKSTQLDIKNREDTFDVSALEDGNYTVTVSATDSYGNIGTSQEAVTINVDNTPPAISIQYNGEAMPDTISDLRDLRFALTDNSNASVTTGRLYGSSSNENVYLGIISQGDKVFSFEQPKIFPTLLEGESYSLEVIAQDDYGNTTTKTITFRYVPENLIEMDVQDYLAVSHRLLDGEDQPIARIYSVSPLMIEEGMMATGEQNAYITNRSDSEIGVKVVLADSVVEISPGETKSIVVDLGDAGGKLNIEVYPATVHAGEASLMFDIPQLTSKFN